jgi:hypothetical protein
MIKSIALGTILVISAPVLACDGPSHVVLRGKVLTVGERTVFQHATYRAELELDPAMVQALAGAGEITIAGYGGASWCGSGAYQVSKVHHVLAPEPVAAKLASQLAHLASECPSMPLVTSDERGFVQHNLYDSALQPGASMSAIEKRIEGFRTFDTSTDGVLAWAASQHPPTKESEIFVQRSVLAAAVAKYPMAVSPPK